MRTTGLDHSVLLSQCLTQCLDVKVTLRMKQQCSICQQEERCSLTTTNSCWCTGAKTRRQVLPSERGMRCRWTLLERASTQKRRHCLACPADLIGWKFPTKRRGVGLMLVPTVRQRLQGQEWPLQALAQVWLTCSHWDPFELHSTVRQSFRRGKLGASGTGTGE